MAQYGSGPTPPGTPQGYAPQGAPQGYTPQGSAPPGAPPGGPPVPPPKSSGAGVWVIAIVGLLGCGFIALMLLAAIMFPVFARARENARRASCASNLKQIGLAMMMYSQDNGESFPPASFSEIGASNGPLGWADAMQPYFGSRQANPQIFQCPSESTAASTDPGTVGYTDYFYNSNLSRRSLSQIKSLSTTVLAGDGDPGDATSALSSEPTGGAATRHLETANYLFSDGHVKAVRPPLASQMFQFNVQ